MSEYRFNYVGRKMTPVLQVSQEYYANDDYGYGISSGYKTTGWRNATPQEAEWLLMGSKPSDDTIEALRDAHMAISSYVAGLEYAASHNDGFPPDADILRLRNRLRAILAGWKNENLS